MIQFKKSPCGGTVVSDCNVNHNHPIPKACTVYAVHRKQSSETMKLILDTLALAGPNPVDTVMHVRIDVLFICML